MQKRVLVVSFGFLPAIGGSYRVLQELVSRVACPCVTVLTCKDRRVPKRASSSGYELKRSVFISLLNENGFLFGRFYTHHLYKFLRFRLIKRTFRLVIFPIVAFIYVLSLHLRDRNSHVIFAQSVLPFAWFIYLIRRISAAKVITFVYGEDIVPLRKQEMAKRISRKIYLTGLRNVDYIIANSKVTMNEVIRDGIATGKVTVIHPAVDYDFFTLQDRREMKERLGLTDKFVLLSVGRLVRRKGFDRVIEQMPRLIKEIPNILYIICGEGPDDTRLREIASRNGAVKYIKFIRGLPTVDLPVLYSASDLFVMPNRLDDINGDQEGFGIVFLEANACGLPVIGGDSGGVRDVIEDRVNGFLVDPLDSERLAELIVECYLGKHSFEPTKIREHIMQRFSWTHSSSSFNSLLAIT